MWLRRLARSLTFTHAHCSRRFPAQSFIAATNPPHYSGERWSSRVQQTEAGSDTLTPLWRSRDFLDNTETLSSDLITTNTPDIFVGVFCVCGFAFSSGHICFLFFFSSFLHLSRLKSVINARSESSGGSCVLLNFYGHYTKRPGGESAEIVEPLTLTFSFTHEPPPEKIRRNCGVQCMSESSLSHTSS